MSPRWRRVRVPVNPPVASMGDIAFLLIIFFVVTSDFIRARSGDFVLPKTKDIEEQQKVPPVAVVIEKNGDIRVDGRRVEQSAVESEVNARCAAKWGADTTRYRVLFQADRNQTEFIDVIKAIAEAHSQLMMAGEIDK